MLYNYEMRQISMFINILDIEKRCGEYYCTKIGQLLKSFGINGFRLWNKYCDKIKISDKKYKTSKWDSFDECDILKSMSKIKKWAKTDNPVRYEEYIEGFQKIKWIVDIGHCKLPFLKKDIIPTIIKSEFGYIVPLSNNFCYISNIYHSSNYLHIMASGITIRCYQTDCINKIYGDKIIKLDRQLTIKFNFNVNNQNYYKLPDDNQLNIIKIILDEIDRSKIRNIFDLFKIGYMLGSWSIHESVFNLYMNFCEQFHDFYSRIEKPYPIGIEIRNKNYLTPDYFKFLQSEGIIHVFSEKLYMPSVYKVFTQYRDYLGDTLVVRLLGGDRLEIEKTTNKTWNKIVDEKPDKKDIISMSLDAKFSHGKVIINVNNHYEGSAPLTIAALKQIYKSKRDAN